MLRIFRCASLAYVLLAWSAVAACKTVPAPPARSTTRAMWVTRWDFKTKDDVLRIADSCAQLGLNTINFQVRGNATAFYRSKLEPWAEQFDFADPGFDPLATMLEAAHAKGIRVNAWANVTPAWYGMTPPKDKSHVWNAHPEWLWYDQHGKRQAFSEKFYVSLNPCLPEVRKYLVDVMRDIVSRYPIDGLHLDYIRFPNEDPAIPKGSKIDYPRDAQTLALFAKDTGKTPEQDPSAWNRWRTDRVTELVRAIRKMTRETKKNVELSAAVGALPENAITHFQDAKGWLAEDLVDAVYPMNYTDDPKEYERRCAYWQSVAGNHRVVMGVYFEKGDTGVLTEELGYALRTFRGFAIFAYSSLFESPNDAVDRPDPASKAKRDQRGKAMAPVLQDLARAP